MFFERVPHGEGARTQITAKSISEVGMHEPHVILERRLIGVLGAAVRTVAAYGRMVRLSERGGGAGLIYPRPLDSHRGRIAASALLPFRYEHFGFQLRRVGPRRQLFYFYDALFDDGRLARDARRQLSGELRRSRRRDYRTVVVFQYLRTCIKMLKY